MHGAKINQVEGGSRNTIKSYLVQDGIDQAVEITSENISNATSRASKKEGEHGSGRRQNDGR